MDFELELILLYVFISDEYQNKLWVYSERMSPNKTPLFSDEEVLTVYLWGILEGHSLVSECYKHSLRYLKSYFPNLPSYQAFNKRLNNLAGSLPPLAESLQSLLPSEEFPSAISLLDSMPIVLAKGNRRQSAKVAPHNADYGRCETKKMNYYGVKVHLLGQRVAGTLPKPAYIEVTPASEHDSQLLNRIDEIPFEDLFTDKAYAGKRLYDRLKRETQTTLVTPVKKLRNGPEPDTADRWYSRAVSRIRQPIESLFNWIQEKTNIQNASKVRSIQGLNVHIWAKITAALWLMIF